MKFAAGMLLAFWGTWFASTGAWAGTPGEVKSGEALREADLRPLGGVGARLSAFRGKPLLINVWASWCGPCRAEMASLDQLARRYDGRQFNLIGISTDDDAAAALAFLKTSRVGFRNYIDRNLLLENMLGADRLPLTILVDAEGRVIKKIAGSRDWSSPEAINLITHAFRLNDKSPAMPAAKGRPASRAGQ